ncbi:MAG: oxidoreductase [Gammaproteobacteria bacterium]|nr:oxidoreductase [Gammaproteobacteria bacterium]MCB1922675.1 oxidoreductase [Gammaproteobacteria bacterium]
MTEIAQEIGPVSEAVIVDSVRITPDDRDEVRRIRLRVDDPAFRFLPGHLIGVVVPGPHAFGNRYHTRRYSIASGSKTLTGEGIEFDLLVRRCFLIDEFSGERHPGVASHFLCDATAGQHITITGPFRSPFRIPERDDANLLMIGTGTGVAPFRAFIQEIYSRKTGWHGQVRLYYGARTGMDLLYQNDEFDDLANYYDRDSFKAFRAVMSKPMASENDTFEAAIAGNAQDIWELMQDAKSHVYLAGINRVADAFDRLMQEAATSQSVWRETKAWMQKEGRWSELIYS